MKALIEIVVGLLFLVVGVFLLTYKTLLMAFLTIVRGGIVSALFLLGLGIILLGISELKE